MKVNTFALVTLTALASLLVLPASAATDPATDTKPSMHGEQARQHMGAPRGGMMREPEARIERLDTNDDGKISQEEFLTPALDRLDDMFERRDTNGDGLIAEGEGRPQRPAARGNDDGNRPGRAARGERPTRGERPARGANVDRDEVLACVQQQVPDFELPERPDGDDVDDRFADVDTNGDGSLSLGEVTASVTANAQARFARQDSNGDGFITTDEIEALQDARAETAKAMRDCVQQQRGN